MHAKPTHAQATGSGRAQHAHRHSTVRQCRAFSSSHASRNNRHLGRVAASSSQRDTADSSPWTTRLGNTDLEVSRLGIGTIQWGDTTKGFGPTFDEEDLYGAFEAARVGGINFFDTAEVYGYQSLKDGKQSEQLLGGFVRRADGALPIEGPPPIVASKYFTIPWTNVLIGGGVRLGRQAMLDALQASLTRLDTDRLDLWQVHFPFPTYPQKTLAAGLQEAVESGLVRAVGVSNYSAAQVEEIHGLLAQQGIPLASNQVKFSILDRSAERDGVLAKCAELGVSVIAHSPLFQGLLTGRTLEVDSPSGKAEQVRPLLQLMQFIGALSGSRSVTQVALNWLMCKGAIPIAGAKSASQVKDSVGALGWTLDGNEVAMIEEKLNALKL